ncbi:MAG: HAD-IC family P-type ATPase, partial [Propionibacteriaceae bacterium]|nr:HAD-IC family P-type ATPase [Propionibacteriaceae bacterium]
MSAELQGLSAAEVAQRIEQGQVNTLPERSGRSTWQIVRANVFTRVNVMYAVLFAIVAVTGQLIQGVFALLIIVNSAIGMIQELRAKRTLDNLAVIGEAHPLVLRDGERVSLPRDQVVIDDLIVINPGDQIVVDGEVVANDYLEVDESMLTGEADPIAKTAGDELLSGAFVVSGTGVYRATKVGAAAYAAQLTAQAAKFTLVNSELRSGIDKILRFVSFLMVPVALLTIWVQFNQSGATWQDSALRMVAALTPMIPEGLVLMTSIAFALGVIRLGQRKCLVQELPAIEGLARVSVVCADKTGTLTQNAMTLGEIIPL